MVDIPETDGSWRAVWGVLDPRGGELSTVQAALVHECGLAETAPAAAVDEGVLERVYFRVEDEVLHGGYRFVGGDAR